MQVGPPETATVPDGTRQGWRSEVPTPREVLS